MNPIFLFFRTAVYARIEIDKPAMLSTENGWIAHFSTLSTCMLNGCFSPSGRNKKSRNPHKDMLCHKYRQFTIVHKKGDVKTGGLL